MFRGRKDKIFDFSEILATKALELTFYEEEDRDLVFRNKFSMTTLTREYLLFAKTEDERDLWVQSFLKVIEFNTQTEGDFNLKIPPKIQSN